MNKKEETFVVSGRVNKEMHNYIQEQAKLSEDNPTTTWVIGNAILVYKTIISSFEKELEEKKIGDINGIKELVFKFNKLGMTSKLCKSIYKRKKLVDKKD